MKLRLLTEDKEFFGYDAISKPMWDEKFKEAKKEFGVSFSLENDDTIVERVITIPQKQWESSKCTFHCQMRKGGGDWERPSIYFRCQLWDGYAFELSQYHNPYFCFIPNKEQGNLHLLGSKGNQTSPNNDSGLDDIEPDERKCWASLNDYLKELVDKEIKEVKKGNS
jgi:hypothetical protein